MFMEQSPEWMDSGQQKIKKNKNHIYKLQNL